MTLQSMTPCEQRAGAFQLGSGQVNLKGLARFEVVLEAKADRHSVRAALYAGFCRVLRLKLSAESGQS